MTKHKRIWFINRIGTEVWQDGGFKQIFNEWNRMMETHRVLTKISITKQNAESLYISQSEKNYKYSEI